MPCTKVWVIWARIQPEGFMATKRTHERFEGEACLEYLIGRKDANNKEEQLS